MFRDIGPRRFAMCWCRLLPVLKYVTCVCMWGWGVGSGDGVGPTARGQWSSWIIAWWNQTFWLRLFILSKPTLTLMSCLSAALAWSQYNQNNAFFLNLEKVCLSFLHMYKLAAARKKYLFSSAKSGKELFLHSHCFFPHKNMQIQEFNPLDFRRQLHTSTGPYFYKP